MSETRERLAWAIAHTQDYREVETPSPPATADYECADAILAAIDERQEGQTVAILDQTGRDLGERLDELERSVSRGAMHSYVHEAIAATERWLGGRVEELERQLEALQPPAEIVGDEEAEARDAVPPEQTVGGLMGDGSSGVILCRDCDSYHLASFPCLGRLRGGAQDHGATEAATPAGREHSAPAGAASVQPAPVPFPREPRGCPTPGACSCVPVLPTIERAAYERGVRAFAAWLMQHSVSTLNALYDVEGTKMRKLAERFLKERGADHD